MQDSTNLLDSSRHRMASELLNLAGFPRGSQTDHRRGLRDFVGTTALKLKEEAYEDRN